MLAILSAVIAGLFLAVAAILSHALRKRQSLWSLQWLVALLTATTPFVLDHYLQAADLYSGVHKSMFTVCRFMSISMVIGGVFGIIEATVGEAPPDATMNLRSWIEYLTTPVDLRRGPDKRPIKAKPGAMLAAIGRVVLNWALLSVSFSVLASAGNGRFRPFQDTTTSQTPATPTIVWLADNWLASFVVYAFLALTLEVPGLKVIAEGYEAVQPFHNPMFGPTSPTDLWSRRWNMHIHGGGYASD